MNQNQFSIEPHLSFCKFPNGEVVDTIWQLLKQGLWKEVNVEQFIENTKIGELKREQWKPIISNLLPLQYGMEWSAEKQQIIEPHFIPEIRTTTYLDLERAIQHFFEKYKDKHIGVQLSGGLDSSIVISYLNKFKIPFSLIGMTSNRYEFRTEKHIQEIYAPLGKNTVLIDFEEHLPFRDLENVPPHQYPDLLSINYSANLEMAEQCKKMGIEILLTGSGGDNVFAEPIPENPNLCTWMPKGFVEGWLNDNIYQSHGVQLVPFYGDEGILNAIYNLRIGDPEDNAKLWARDFFKEILPQELVNFTYCADFWGLYISGLQDALPEIEQLFEKAYTLTNNSIFSKEHIEKIYAQDLLNAKKEIYQEFEAMIAVAVWINSLPKSFKE